METPQPKTQNATHLPPNKHAAPKIQMQGIQLLIGALRRACMAGDRTSAQVKDGVRRDERSLEPNASGP